MGNRLRLAVLTGGAMASLALPVAAHAGTKTVFMGEPPNVANTFEQNYSSDVSDFFPHGVTIHVGDKVNFIPGFHTVDFPGRGQKALAVAIPSGTPASGVNDQAGNPFWFNGQTEFENNPGVFAPGHSPATYNGTKRVDSGINVGPGRPQPFVVKFTKKGSFTYYCDVHPGMKGVVHVVAKTARIPSARADAKAVKKQISTALAQAKQLVKTKAPTGTVLVGAGTSAHVEYYGYFGPTAPIAAGTTLKFQMGKGALEVHTATTDSAASSAPPPAPGGNDAIPSPYLNTLSNAFNGNGPVDPRATFASDQAGGTPASLSPSLHGNGFWNTGILTNAGKVLAFPSNQSVRFDTPGTYTFYCLIHNFMHFTIKVQ